MFRDPLKNLNENTLHERKDSASLPGLRVDQRALLHQKQFISALIALPERLPYVSNLPRPYADPSEAIRRVFYGPSGFPELPTPSENSAITSLGEFSVASSLRCLSDVVRTRRFAEGVVKAVSILGRRFPEGEIRVCEAGCGALPFMSLLAAVVEPRVTVTSLDVHGPSIALARATPFTLGVGERIRFLHEDARRYQPEKPFHLVISETMDSGLLQEPIAEILGNLRGHLLDGGIMIPEAMTLEAGLLRATDVEALHAGWVLPYGALLTEVSPERFTASVSWRTKDALNALEFPFEGSSPDLDDSIAIQTAVVVLGADHSFPAGTREGDPIVLTPRDSAITAPTFLSAGLEEEAGRGSWKFSYRPGKYLNGFE